MASLLTQDKAPVEPQKKADYLHGSLLPTRRECRFLHVTQTPAKTNIMFVKDPTMNPERLLPHWPKHYLLVFTVTSKRNQVLRIKYVQSA